MRVCLILICMTVAGCASNVSTTANRVYRVSSSAELLKAIGSDRTIVLDGNVYFLSEMADDYKSSSRVEFVTDYVDRELHIRGVQNMTIRGKKGERPVILTEPQYGNVLVFKESDNIRLENLTIGHGPPRGFCTGGVLRFESCSSLAIDDCLLFGSGTEGIAAEKCSSVLVTKTRIENCTYNIMTIGYSDNLNFKNCLFTKNESQVSGLINIHSSSAISFEGCEIIKNGTDYTRYLFEAYDSPPVTIDRCLITDNVVTAVANDDRSLHVVNSTVRDNRPPYDRCCDEP